MTYSKSSNKERGLIQNPATEREDLFKIKQHRERTYSKSSNRERGLIQNPTREREKDVRGVDGGIVNAIWSVQGHFV